MKLVDCKIGMTVKLVSGGPLLTVVAFSTDDEQVIFGYFDDSGRFRDEDIYPEALVACPTAGSL